ncbi:MAG TPA: alginate lyase family protein [Bacillota bacterium]|nr:alginate lyase family protein [Bacillota bacterium]
MLGKIIRLIQKNPQYILRRLFQAVRERIEFFLAPCRIWAFKRGALLGKMGYPDIDCLWEALGETPYFTPIKPIDGEHYRKLCPGDQERIMEAAQAALLHQVNLLGSGRIELGRSIDWHQDYKTGLRWRPEYYRRINYLNPDQPSDVKFPWELSRLQWLIPVGQAYLLTGDERYATAIRDILQDWMESNPYAGSVNWACTMEVALRIVTLSWFFEVFWKSQAWLEPGFRLRFLSNLYLHGDFTARHLECSDINGNHYTADAAGLTVAGIFFGRGTGGCRTAGRWAQRGWEILSEEITRQVYPDGVDFEMSIAYHRLVLELFFLPALYRKACGLPVANEYGERLIAMARFTAAYDRNSHPAPLWGDADDGRVLPFGGQPINDHRYLTGLVGIGWNVPELVECFSGSRAEILWWLGPEAAAGLPGAPVSKVVIESQAYPNAGFYIMRNDRDHIFVDCAPVGLAGRGGHGHNDLLSFEAVLDGVHLVSDCGAYVYTASYQERNWFRSTACHNTPQIDDLEINRYVHPDYLWSLHDDAHPVVKRWESSPSRVVLVGAHDGYQRLKDPVIPERTIILEQKQHHLLIRDRFLAKGEHSLKIPLHLAPFVEAQALAPGRLSLQTGERQFGLFWNHPGDWELKIEPARVSPSYGTVRPSLKLIWQRQGLMDKELILCLGPADNKNNILNDPGWVYELLREIDRDGG